MSNTQKFKKRNNLNMLPLGMHDIMPDECYNLSVLDNKVQSVFNNWGYQKIDTPTLEFYDNFRLGNAAIPQQRMFKLVDIDNNILVMRPDFTLPISRIAGTKLNNGVNKLYYSGKVYKTELSSESATREYLQTGVEYIGKNLPAVDAEVIMLSIEALKECGLKEFFIEIGSAEFFNALMEEYGIEGEIKNFVKDATEKRSILEVEKVFNENNIDSKALNAIAQLPLLFGGKEVFKKAEELSLSNKTKLALNKLKEVFGCLVECGYEKYISIDLGLVKSNDYYNGIVFKGLCKYFGAAILLGGRYDNLSEAYGESYPATGFALYLKRVYIALGRQGSELKSPCANITVFAKKISKDLIEAVSALRKQGKSVNIVYYEDENEMEDFCANNCQTKVLLFDKDKLTER